MSSVDCYIFVADDKEATQLDPSEELPSDSYSTDAFISITLAELWAMTQDRAYDLELQEQFKVLVDRDDGSFTVERFPADFVNRLANIAADQEESLLEQWSQTDENSSLPEEAVEEMLQELIRLAKIAKASQKQLYICNEC